MTEILPGLGVVGEWDPGDNGWSGDMNHVLRLVSALVQAAVLGRESVLPSPTAGDIYIYTGTGTYENHIAICVNSAWVYLTPREGWLVYDQDENVFVTFDGTEWVELDFSALMPDFSGASDGDVLTIVSGEPAWEAPTSGGGVPAYSRVDQTASYTLVSGDFVGNRVITFSGASAKTVTVPSGISNPEPVSLIRTGTGTVEVVGATGVTVNSSQGFKLRAQYSVATLIPVGTNSYILSGDTEE
jgi:hypothetical protein